MIRSQIAQHLVRLLIAAALAAVLVPASALAGDAEKGKVPYTANCVSCHGESGKGDGPVGLVLQPPPRDFSVAEFKFDANANGKPGEDADLVLVITKGAGAFGGNQMMAPWGGLLSDEDINNLVAYIRTLKK